MGLRKLFKKYSIRKGSLFAWINWIKRELGSKSGFYFKIKLSLSSRKGSSFLFDWMYSLSSVKWWSPDKSFESQILLPKRSIAEECPG